MLNTLPDIFRAPQVVTIVVCWKGPVVVASVTCSVTLPIATKRATLHYNNHKINFHSATLKSYEYILIGLKWRVAGEERWATRGPS